MFLKNGKYVYEKEGCFFCLIKIKAVSKSLSDY